MEGLRAPQIGAPLVKPIQQVSGKVAAAAIAAAASAGLAAGGYVLLPDGGGLVPTQYSPYARTAPITTQAPSSLLGNTAQQAPRLANGAGASAAKSLSSAGASGALPGVGKALSGAAGGLAAAAEGLGLQGAARGAGRLLSPLNPLGAILPDLLFPSGTQKGDAEQAALNREGNKALAKRQAERRQPPRKGDQFPRSKKGADPGLTRYRPASLYRVTFSYNSGTIVRVLRGDQIAVLEVTDDTYKSWYDGRGQAGGSLGQVPKTSDVSKPLVASAIALDGKLDPPPQTPSPETNPDGSPQVNGKQPPEATPEQPSLPGTAAKKPSPTKTSQPPNTGAPTPPQGPRSPERLSQPPAQPPATPGGEASPTLPTQPLPPVNNGNSASSATANTMQPPLPNLPVAPTTGSATAAKPQFASSFTQTPGQRNQETYKPKEEPTEEPTQKPKCKDPCMQELNDKADANKVIAIAVPVFKACKTDSQDSKDSKTTDSSNAIFEEKTIQVPKAEADNYKLLYGRIAKLEALQCSVSNGNAIAAVPEWWQLRPEAQRPQLVILYAEMLATGKLTTSRWSLSLPHYNRPKGYKPKFPSYQKGNYEGILVLTDNSKIIVNGNSETECKRVLNSLKLNIPAQYRLKNGKAIKAKVGERLNGDFKRCRVVPIRADFFSTGMRNLTPDWTITLRQ